MTPKRIFLALPIEPVELAAGKMNQLQKLLSNYRIKWVGPENFHVTLFFFGEIQFSQIVAIKNLLYSVLKNSSPFTFSFLGPAIFKKGKEQTECKVSKLILFESKLFPTGPKYYPIEVFPLMS